MENFGHNAIFVVIVCAIPLVLIYFLVSFVNMTGNIWGEPFEPSTFEDREEDPLLNTNDWDQHWRRIRRFSKSRYQGEMYYMGPKGGYYTYSANGNRVYK